MTQNFVRIILPAILIATLAPSVQPETHAGGLFVQVRACPRRTIRPGHRHRRSDKKARIGVGKKMSDILTPVRRSEIESSRMKKAGEFNGDVRDLPAEKPVPMERPRHPDPKIRPKVYPTPKIDQQ